MYWKLAIWKVTFGMFKVAVTGYLGATTAVSWSSMSGEERFLVLLMIALAIGTFVDGFLDQTLARLVAGKPLVALPPVNGNGNGHGNTEIITKTQTKVTTPNS
jgi:hypothetical protein